MRYHPYHSSAPEIVGLLEWCPDHKIQPDSMIGNKPDGLYPLPLPWEETPPPRWGREQD